MKYTIFFFVLLFSTSTFAQAPSIDKILADAYKQAQKEKKNVFVMFHASWCGWCKKMDQAMNDESCKKFFDDNYVIVHVVTGEHSEDKKALNNPGAEDFLKKRRGEGIGLPYWLILDKKGKTLADAHLQADKPSNIGCPAADEEVVAFVEKIKKTSKLQQAELEIIAERFKKNNPN